MVAIRQPSQHTSQWYQLSHPGSAAWGLSSMMNLGSSRVLRVYAAVCSPACSDLHTRFPLSAALLSDVCSVCSVSPHIFYSLSLFSILSQTLEKEVHTLHTSHEHASD